MIVYFCVKYRARSGQKFGINSPATRENRDSNWKGPLLICVLMGIILIGAGSQSFITYNTFSSPIHSTNTLHITVIGHQFAWTFVYQNGFVSEDVAVVPTNTVVVFNVTSRDVYHQFGLPYFRVKTDAIPGRMSSVWIMTTQAGNFTVQCFELCGVGHATMIGTLSVVNPVAYAEWYAASSASGSAT